MEKFELLKAIIYQLICENKLVTNVFECKRKHGQPLPFFEVSYTKGSFYIHNTNTIKLGSHDIINSYELAKEYIFFIIDVFHFDAQYLERGFGFNKSKGISIKYSGGEKELVIEKLKNTDFLKVEKENTMTKHDTIAIYAMAYSLYHEIGHYVYDSFSSNKLHRERVADYFAFEALMHILYGEKEENNVLIGTFLGISQVLLQNSPKQEEGDEEHPHSIERLYHLFDYWGVQDESCYWKFAHDIVYKWSAKNKLDISSWERDTSKSYKDKFIDAYICFRKNPQM